MKAVMTNDNGLDVVQKVKVISKFTDAAVVDRQWRRSSTDQKFCILIYTRGNPYPWICQARIFPTDQSPTDMGTSMD